tara:strand:+ start:398 stop:565 length:168 start_codon:yes stop_codon:yes gene_type:complete
VGQVAAAAAAQLMVVREILRQQHLLKVITVALVWVRAITVREVVVAQVLLEQTET